MSRLIGTLSVALVLFVAGTASADDGTKVIYDLSGLGQTDLRPISDSAVSETSRPQPSSVRSGADPAEFQIQWSAGDLELVRRGHSHAPNNGTKLYSPPKRSHNPPVAAPNPEPGTLVLLGSGLAAGAGFMRRRVHRGNR